jgi:membrane-anchored protein YejM (alkaline phosphatase superfamily)
VPPKEEAKMADITSQILVLIVLAFCLWLGLLLTFRWMKMPLASFLAAVLSWAVATLSIAWTIDVLRGSGHWPLM